MGVVWKAIDTRLNRPVAIKFSVPMPDGVSGPVVWRWVGDRIFVEAGEQSRQERALWRASAQGGALEPVSRVGVPLHRARN